MYPAIARGYATQYLNNRPRYETLTNWFNGAGSNKASRVFLQACQKKKPGRIDKHMSSVLRPLFHIAYCGAWQKNLKVYHAEAITSAQENSVFSLTDRDAEIFKERSVFLTNFILSVKNGRAISQMATTASISHHALARILERDLTTKDSLHKETRVILKICRMIALSSLDISQTNAFLIPYGKGALPAVTMQIRPDPNDPKDISRVLAIRTYLDPSMLDDEDRERMGGFEAAVMSAVEVEDPYVVTQWAKANARPFDLMSKKERAKMHITEDFVT